jgi:hypothetical protein
LYVRRFISAAAVLVSIGICIFITWISRDVDQSTILFNLAFLCVMLLMIGASILFGLGRLMGICRSLRDAAEEIRSGRAAARRKDDPLFQNDFHIAHTQFSEAQLYLSIEHFEEETVPQSPYGVFHH